MNKAIELPDQTSLGIWVVFRGYEYNSTSVSEQLVDKEFGGPKKAGPGETPNSQQWFNAMLTFLRAKNLARVADPSNAEYAEIKQLEMSGAGNDAVKKAMCS